MSRQGSKAGKSNKTARVLSLLTDPAALADTPAPAAPKKTEAPQRVDDKQAQADIRNALEQELLSSAPAQKAAAPVPQSAPAPQAAPVQQSAPQPAPVPQAAPVQQSAPQPAPVQQAAPVQQSAPQPAPVQQAAPVSPSPQPPANEEDDYICFNLTEALVEAKADKYMKLFGMCTCPRCRVDVIAIALQNLPPKYVATQSREVVPLLSMYEGKYSAAIIAQVMSACKMVIDRPHHGRKT